MSRLLNSESIGVLLSAISRDDDELLLPPGDFWNEWDKLMLREKRRRAARRQKRHRLYRIRRQEELEEQKRQTAKLWTPRIEFFEEPDVPMIDPGPRILPELVLVVAPTTEPELERILARMRSERWTALMLSVVHSELREAEAELENLRAQLKGGAA